MALASESISNMSGSTTFISSNRPLKMAEETGEKNKMNVHVHASKYDNDRGHQKDKAA
jgi:hypothetical protein